MAHDASGLRVLLAKHHAYKLTDGRSCRYRRDKQYFVDTGIWFKHKGAGSGTRLTSSRGCGISRIPPSRYTEAAGGRASRARVSQATV